MSFDPSIPQATDIISQSQGQILTNFSQSNTIFDVDHITFNNATTAARGRHRQITFNDYLGADPDEVTPIASLYTKSDSSGALYFQNDTGAANVYPLVQDRQGAGPNYTMQVGKLIINYGTVTSGGGNTITVTFNTAFSDTNYVCLGMPSNGGTFQEGQWTVQNASNTQATFRRGSSTVGVVAVAYIAIGV